jgi:phosphatidylserine synthase
LGEIGESSVRLSSCRTVYTVYVWFFFFSILFSHRASFVKVSKREREIRVNLVLRPGLVCAFFFFLLFSLFGFEDIGVLMLVIISCIFNFFSSTVKEINFDTLKEK